MLVCLLPDRCPYPSDDPWFGPTPVLSSPTGDSVPPVVNRLQSELLVELPRFCGGALKNEGDAGEGAPHFISQCANRSGALAPPISKPVWERFSLGVNA